MFSAKKIMRYTGRCWDNMAALKKALEAADSVIIGAGAGLSTAAGFVYDGERFQKYFGDFIKKYGFGDMYSGGFYPFPSPEEHWAYWSRYVYINRYMDPPKPIYETLLQLVKNKDYFILTTNVDHCFQKTGFDRNRLFYTQGDYGLFQCSEPCCQETFDNETLIRQMVERQENMSIPTDLVPKCPHCGRPMTMNLRADDRFVEDEGWRRAAERYSEFLRRHQGTRTLFLELGVGWNTPGIIKFPFWQMACQWPEATYACVNLSKSSAPPELCGRAICIQDDIGAVLTALADADDAYVS